ncbi:hypothetical protein QBC38DRAFT_73353 [Podospora fimiseda]|uniref:Nephrocystin 3-like N-terminal domain-containing protein n=1 Tax=Podospora fimiseda TaxID=252190 RepID=A0AAN7BFY2_9PEZI|nr:hypothetical protein QBC38DRAFT_73353 [Podospora fimiseda]
MQRNLAGFLRRILYQAINHHEEFAKTVFEERLRTHIHLGPDLAWRDPWTEVKLQRLLLRLLNEAHKCMRVTLFIDGLDEYEGNPHDTLALLDRIRGSCMSLKLCISSRPWTEFQAKLSHDPKLKMHELNGSDIDRYVDDQISSHLCYTSGIITRVVRDAGRVSSNRLTNQHVHI